MKMRDENAKIRRENLPPLSTAPLRVGEGGASAPERTRCSFQHRNSSEAETAIMTAACGTAEVVPLRGREIRMNLLGRGIYKNEKSVIMLYINHYYNIQVLNLLKGN
jgi:hypothetical protein